MDSHSLAKAAARDLLILAAIIAVATLTLIGSAYLLYRAAVVFVG